MPLVLTAAELRKVDAATIAEQGISSLALMERAASACALAIDRLLRERYTGQDITFTILCGRGNNGGDGWVLARLLHARNYPVEVIDFELGSPSPDNAANRQRAAQLPIFVQTLQAGDPVPAVAPKSVLIDAIFGTGLNRPVSGEWATVFRHINALPNPVWAIDIPSGLFTDTPTNSVALQCAHSFSLGYPKLAEFSPENEEYFGDIQRVHFSLAAAEDHVVFSRELLTRQVVSGWHLPRKRFGHKGTYGHALLVAGSYGSIGAAVLAARATLRSGAGKLTCHLPSCGYQIMQIAVPEAMCTTDKQEAYITEIANPDAYTVIGIGPGIGQAAATAAALQNLLERADKPLVLDADALNILARHPEWMALLPPGSVLTPHPKEFDRLFGDHQDTFARWETQRRQASALDVVVLLKGGYTSVAAPDGTLTFNPTGNPGMGSAGMGDVLTGIITGLVAQGYVPAVAARLGAYLHGLAGDLGAAAGYGPEHFRGAEECLIASDVVDQLPAAFTALRREGR